MKSVERREEETQQESERRNSQVAAGTGVSYLDKPNKSSVSVRQDGNVPNPSTARNSQPFDGKGDQGKQVLKTRVGSMVPRGNERVIASPLGDGPYTVP